MGVPSLLFAFFIPGIINILGNIRYVQAVSMEDDGTCGNRVVDNDNSGVSDAVRRKLIVEVGVEI